MTAREWVLDFPRPDEWVSANARDHWAVKAAKTKAWREAAATHAQAANIPLLHRVHFTCEPRWTTRKRRDALNIAPTIKAVIDGIVDAGVIVDDADEYVTGVEVRNGPAAKGVARLRITITEVVA